MKKIIVICKSSNFGNRNKAIHYDWIQDCSAIFDIKLWGEGFNDPTIDDLKKTVDEFQPDYIYLTMRKKYKRWLPDISSITVPKIFVECDEFRWSYKDDWYRQFDQIYCRQPKWGKRSILWDRRLGSKKEFYSKIDNIETWGSVPVFRWSVPDNCFPKKNYRRSGVKFIGRCKDPEYIVRRHMKHLLTDTVFFGRISGQDNYWKTMYKTSILICPTESNYGDFIPAKIFEYLASGAAVLTNCDLKAYGIQEFEPFIMRYRDITDICRKIKISNAVDYYNKAIPTMRNHTHSIRYKEIFK